MYGVCDEKCVCEVCMGEEWDVECVKSVMWSVCVKCAWVKSVMWSVCEVCMGEECDVECM